VWSGGEVREKREKFVFLFKIFILYLVDTFSEEVLATLNGRCPG